VTGVADKAPLPLEIGNSFAYYLPQFHTIPENDAWWGDGFTEWTHLRKAKPFLDHHQIQYPSELGYYDLTSAEVIGKQYALARQHSINTFTFWHYWFGTDDLLLEKPAELLLDSDEEVEFCFAWANHDWLKRATGQVLRVQRYEDVASHFAYLEPFFHDKRYRRIAGKPVFFVFAPKHHPDLPAFIEAFQKLAQQSGLPGVTFIFDHCRAGDGFERHCDYYFNAGAALKFEGKIRRASRKLRKKLGRDTSTPTFMKYSDCAKNLNKAVHPQSAELPLVFPGWDTTIRHGKNGLCLLGTCPEDFEGSLERVKDVLGQRALADRHLVIKSWNEWAEGNFMEPSQEHGRKYLQAFARHFVTRSSRSND
jgi:hypothetical protein